MRYLNKWIVPTVLLILALPCACGGDGPANAPDGKLRQKPEVNEVRVITLEETDFPYQVLSNGKLSAAARAGLAFRSAGPVSAIHAGNGQSVPAGFIIAAVDRPDLHLALESARNVLEKARYELFDYLAGQGYPARDTVSVPEELLAVAKMQSGYHTAKNALDAALLEAEGTVLTAPFAGRIADIRLKPFEQTLPETFCTLVDDRFLDVDFTVMESEYGFLAQGLKVRVVPYADESLRYEGTVTSVNPSVDRNGQILVRARIRNDGRLIDGMNVKITVERTVPGKLVVPRSAVVIRDNLDVLFTYSDDGRAHWVYVDIVASNGDSHAVTANRDRGAVLRAGDRVIVSGNLNLADGSQVVLKD